MSNITTSYHTLLTSEFLQDSTSSVLDKWESIGGPQLISRLEATRSDEAEYFPLLRMVLHVASELMADEDAVGLETVIEPFCVAAFRLKNIPINLPVDGESILAKAMRETPLANLMSVCRNEVIGMDEIGCPVLMQKLKRKNMIELAQETEAELSISDLDSLGNILNFFSSTSEEKLRKGLVLPSEISLREFIDRVLELLPGFPRSGWVGIPETLDDFYTLGQMDAVGKFFAFSLLNMEPLGLKISYDVIYALMRPVDSSQVSYVSYFCRGFQALMDPGILRDFSPFMLQKFFEGREIETGDIVVDADENLSHLLTPTNILDWANRSSGGRGVALGDFGPKFVLKIRIDESQSENVVFKIGGQVFVSRTRFSEMH